MKYLLIFISLFIFGCNDESELTEFTSKFRNETSSELNIKGYNVPRDLVFDETVLSSQSTSDCVTFSESFLGISCSMDSIVFIFNNNKGYISTTFGNNFYSFSNKSPHDGSELSFSNLDNNTYEFIITEEDFENAFELPE